MGKAHQDETEVLIVGAGPVGLWTAIRLAEADIEIAIIDREARSAARSYACALHPQTLQLLHSAGLAGPALAAGRRISKAAFYDGNARRAEVRIGSLDTRFPFLLVLPQNAFEGVLEQRLNQLGVEVQWNHRFDGLEQDGAGVTARVEELSGTGTGYIVPHWETVVKKSRPMRARFLAGTDGHHSLVRQRLDIPLERLSEPEFFAAYEFECEESVTDEMRVVLDDTTTNVYWPLPGNRGRWTFQLTRSGSLKEFPSKERQPARLAQPAIDESIRQYVQRVAGQRAPWFSTKVKEINWCTQVVFEQRLARAYGRNRCWLAGDAAHQTGPVGVQGLNIGLREAESLASSLCEVLRGKAPAGSLSAYETQWLGQWQELLRGRLEPAADADSWTREHAGRLLPCLPGSNGDLVGLAAQLKLGLSHPKTGTK